MPCVGNCLRHSCHSTVPLLEEDPTPSKGQDGCDFLIGRGLHAGTALILLLLLLCSTLTRQSCPHSDLCWLQGSGAVSWSCHSSAHMHAVWGCPRAFLQHPERREWCQCCIHSCSSLFSLLGRWAWASARCCFMSPRLWQPRTSRARWRCSAWRCGS